MSLDAIFYSKTLQNKTHNRNSNIEKRRALSLSLLCAFCWFSCVADEKHRLLHQSKRFLANLLISVANSSQRFVGNTVRVLHKKTHTWPPCVHAFSLIPRDAKITNSHIISARMLSVCNHWKSVIEFCELQNRNIGLCELFVGHSWQKQLWRWGKKADRIPENLTSKKGVESCWKCFFLLILLTIFFFAVLSRPTEISIRFTLFLLFALVIIYPFGCQLFA